ncbi:MAG: hypothetical protein S4CHLAM7_09050 [Chlamydiae bacterium]|nr:hypothetical protein [Chlamydiota bacterium]
MNIDSIFSNNLQPIKPVDQTAKANNFPEFISKRLDVLALLSRTVLQGTQSKLKSVVELLQVGPIDYTKCKLLFAEAYIHDFNQKERSYFLDHFFQHFDPHKEVIQIQKLDETSKNFFWNHIISYLCESYMQISTNSLALDQIFNSETCQTNESKEELSVRFDQGMDILLDFSKGTSSFVGDKFLFGVYLARLITSLENLERTEYSSNSINLEDLFNELYYYLLSYPTDNESLHTLKTSALFSISEKDVKSIDSKELHQLFINKLITYINEKNASLTSDDFTYLKEVLSQSSFF